MQKKFLRFLPLAALLLAFQFADAQPVRRGGGTEPPLEGLSDEFSDSASIRGWQAFHTTENYPDKIRSLTVNKGILQLQPYASGWYGDYQAPFLYKMVNGNFDVRARVKASGTGGGLPQSEWSLAGIMVREPGQTKRENWQARNQNWLFFTTGIAEPKGSPVFEVKTTSNSISNLKLRPAREGWVELRIVRIDASFLLLYRYEGEEWTVIERFYRPLLPYGLQVGFNAYSGWNELPGNLKADPALFNSTLVKEVPADLQLEVDYFRFSRPVLNMEKLNALLQPGFRAPYYSPANLLTDYSVSNAQILEILK